MSKIRLRRSREIAYVSMDAGKSWVVIHPDGHTTIQWRTPVDAPLFFSEAKCCEHVCDLDSE